MSSVKETSVSEKAEKPRGTTSRNILLGLLGVVTLGFGLKKIRSQAAKGIVVRSSNQVGSRTDKQRGIFS